MMDAAPKKNYFNLNYLGCGHTVESATGSGMAGNLIGFGARCVATQCYEDATASDKMRLA
jgi:hypothetical protein